jgi:hypothetical protein
LFTTAHADHERLAPAVRALDHAGLSTLSTVSTAEPEAEYAGPFQIIVRASAYAAAEIHLRIIMISPWRCSAVTRD